MVIDGPSWREPQGGGGNLDDGSRRKDYFHGVLEVYRKTPGTTGTVRRPDRLPAEQLYQRVVSITDVENACLLAAARRLMRSADAPLLAACCALSENVGFMEKKLKWLVFSARSRRVLWRAEGGSNLDRKICSV